MQRIIEELEILINKSILWCWIFYTFVFYFFLCNA